MSYFKNLFILVLIVSCNSASKKSADQSAFNEQHRPQIHFSPKEKWMNDPNGLVFHNNTYHLFYQYYPDSTVWGPMHWGHATSTDLVHWEHLPIALFPDTLGYIFSGSAVVDKDNTSGFGKDGKTPLVAIFTHHDPKGEHAGRIDYQYQSIAYSLDDGKTWTKYENNPVLKNPGIKDFRDPKVNWHDESKKWIMTLATLDRISFYSSPNLKDWTKESEFGKDIGAHGGVWECPDLFALDHNGRKIWVLLVSINPGGPNGGSGTQYFTGEFDGKTFAPFDTTIRWIDYGPDDYAGVTWSNTGDRKIFLGWMSNWQYATVVPTEKWRSAMTVPRELSIININDKYMLSSTPVNELNILSGDKKLINGIPAINIDVLAITGKNPGPGRLRIESDSIRNFSITLSNNQGQQLIIGFDKKRNEYFIDRTNAGKKDFEKTFGSRYTAPRVYIQKTLELDLIIDNASVELFADKGLTVMTAIFFPDSLFSNISIQSADDFKLKNLNYSNLKSIHR